MTPLRAPMFHNGSRGLQDEFGSRALADKLESRARTEFTPDDISFITGAEFFFLATADATGQPDCSFKGGPKGFVRVVGGNTLEFPDYDGNGMFKSLGNISANPKAGLLFIAMGETPRRLRVNGTAELIRDSVVLRAFAGAQMVVRLTVQIIFPNCPRYIPDLANDKPSGDIPQDGKAPVEPAWKSFDDFRDIVPPRRNNQ